MSTARQLLVRINNATVGTLSTQDDIWRFAYAPEWIASPQAFALAPGLPLSTAAYIDGATQRPVQWYFDNLLPEEQLRSVLAKEAQIDEADAFGMQSQPDHWCWLHRMQSLQQRGCNLCLCQS